MAEINESLQKENGKQIQSSTTRIGEILISIAAVIYCISIIGMIVGIPMLIRQGKRKRGEMPITIEHVIISLIFFWWIGAILVALGGDVEQK